MGHSWRIGTDAEVAWIAGSTSPNLTIAAAIPPVFAADRAVARAASGAAMVAGVQVTVYADWDYVLVEAGPASLMDRLLAHPDLQARPVHLGEEVTPPGHQAF